jgi:hypothetical protein
MDHEVDKGEMAGREAELRVRLRLPNNLIARVGEEREVRRGVRRVAGERRAGRKGLRRGAVKE